MHAGLHDDFTKQLTPRLQLVLKEIKKEKAKNTPPSTRLPITVEIMANIPEVLLLDSSKYDNILLWAACSLAFFGFLRCGELTEPSQAECNQGAHLSLGDVAIDSKSAPTTIQIIIKQSKTDPLRRGVQLHLRITDSNICPITAILPYLAIRGARPGPLFVVKDGSYLVVCEYDFHYTPASWH